MGSVNTFTPLAKHKRIVIKIGSSLLVDTDTGALKKPGCRPWLMIWRRLRGTARRSCLCPPVRLPWAG